MNGRERRHRVSYRRKAFIEVTDSWPVLVDKADRERGLERRLWFATTISENVVKKQINQRNIYRYYYVRTCFHTIHKTTTLLFHRSMQRVTQARVDVYTCRKPQKSSHPNNCCREKVGKKNSRKSSENVWRRGGLHASKDSLRSVTIFVSFIEHTGPFWQCVSTEIAK